MKELFKTKKFWYITLFAILYLVVAFSSFYHACAFFGLANNSWMSVILAFAFEIGQAAVLFSLLTSQKDRKRIMPWVLMTMFTLVQVIGNIFSSYKYIITNSSADLKFFKEPIFIWTDLPDAQATVIIVYLVGALLPLASLLLTGMITNYLSDESDKNEINLSDESDKKEIDLSNKSDKDESNKDEPNLSDESDKKEINLPDESNKEEIILSNESDKEEISEPVKIEPKDNKESEDNISEQEAIENFAKNFDIKDIDPEIAEVLNKNNIIMDDIPNENDYIEAKEENNKEEIPDIKSNQKSHFINL